MKILPINTHNTRKTNNKINLVKNNKLNFTSQERDSFIKKERAFTTV